MEAQCGIIILAAGESSRLGSPKQLLLYKHTTLLKRSIQVALESVAGQVIVVLGARADAMQHGIANDKLKVIINKKWREGMAGSIHCGLNCLIEHAPDLQTALFMVCDQPFISIDLLDKLVTLQKERGEAIVASAYAGTMGIPAIFGKKLFPELLQLKGDAGAKKLIMEYQDTVATIPFPLGNIDIDTAADYDKLKKM